jgi:hypothetical protein
MDFERNFLVSILKFTKDGPVSEEVLAKDSRVVSGLASRMLFRLCAEGLVSFKAGIVEVGVFERLSLAVKAISLGVDSEQISKFLSWQEFESISAIVLERNGYKVENNVRFKGNGRRWEIDVVGFNKPIVLCIDCKHWGSAISQSSMKKIVSEQIDRTRAFFEAMPDIHRQFECYRWDKAKFVPAIVTLLPGVFKFYEDVPVVPVLQIQDFVHQIPAFVGSLKCFVKSFTHLV